MAVVVVLTAAAPTKVYVCHAAGQTGTTKFVTNHVPATESGFPQGHFTEDGTPEAGHEDDYLGQCVTDETTTTTTEVPPSTTIPPDSTTTTEPAPTPTTVTPTTLVSTTTTVTNESSTTTTSEPSTMESTTTTVQPSTTTSTPTDPPKELPRTGLVDWELAIIGLAFFVAGLAALSIARSVQNRNG